MKLKDLTPEALSRFVGGQLEIRNPNEDYLYRGEVRTIEVNEKGVLKVRFAWLAKMGEDGRWINDGNLDYGVSLWFDRESNQPMSEVQDMGGGRLGIRVLIIWENLVFFPPDGCKLDPAEVVGLSLAS